MAYATTVLPAKQALDTLLRAYSWTGGAPAIRWGEPTEAEDASLDMIWQGAPEVRDEYLTLGAARIDENYELVVVVDVRRYGDDEKATEERAWSLFNQLAALLHSNDTLSGAVNRTTGFTFTPSNDVSGPQQWRTQITVRVAVVGYITP